MRLALAQLNLTVGAFDANLAAIEAAVTRARHQGAELVVLTELAATGYPPRDLVGHAAFVDANLALVDRVSALTDDRFAILIGFVDRNTSGAGKPLHNAVAFCHRGIVAARRYKTLLPTYDVFDEDRYFEPAPNVSPIVFNGIRIGVTICEDVWND